MAGLGLTVEVMRAWRADPGRSLSRLRSRAGCCETTQLVPLLRGVVRDACDALTEDGLLEERGLSGFVVGPDGNCPRRQADDTYPSLVTF